MPNPHQERAPVSARKLLGVLRAAKAQQDLTAQVGKGRGIWLSPQLWQAVAKQLEQQVSEVDALLRELRQKEQEAEQLRRQLEAQQGEHKKAVTDMQTQISEPLARVAALEAAMQAKQEAWDKLKRDLEAQADNLLRMLQDRRGLADDNAGLAEALREAQAARALAERRAAEAEARAAELQRLNDYAMGKTGSDLTERDAQALHIRDLSAALADAQLQADALRRQLAARGSPAEELTQELKRLRGDNQRLVALLAAVPEYRAMAAEMAAEGGVSYLPLEECLLARRLVEELHPQQLDRPVAPIVGGLAGAGRRRDPDGDPDPSLTVVLDEQYHWVPRRALQAGAQLMRRMMPGLPMAQLLALVAELNKVWRDRERQRLAEVAAAHSEELRRLEATFKQRAPYEAVVAGQKIGDLKRQMRAQAAQAAAAAAAARGEQRRIEDDSKVMLHAGLSSIQDLSRQVARLTARNKKLASKLARSEARQRAGGEEASRGPALCSLCLNQLVHPGPNDGPMYVPGPSGPAPQQQPPPPQQPHMPLQPPPGHPGQPGRDAGGAGSYLTHDRRTGSGLSGSQALSGSVTLGERDWAGSPEAPPRTTDWLRRGGTRRTGETAEPHNTRPEDAYPDNDGYGGQDRGWEEGAGAAAEGGGGPGGRAKADDATHGSTASTEPYGAAPPPPPLVRVNVLPSPASPLPSATLSVWRQREATAAAAAAAAVGAAGAASAGAPARHGATVTVAAAPLPAGSGPPVGGTSGGGGGRGGGYVQSGLPPALTVQVQSALAGVTISTGSAAAAGPPPSTLQRAGADGVDGAAGTEASAGSLADWGGSRSAGERTAGAGAGVQAASAGDGGGGGGVESPLALHVQLTGASPCRAVLTAGPAPLLAAAEGGPGGATPPRGGAASLRQRSTPVRVTVRFPRHDVA